MSSTARTLVLALALVVASESRAQSAQRWSLQFSGISVAAQGEAYDGLSNGIGIEAQARLTPGVWSFGAGLQYSAHDLELDIGSETVTLAGIFVEPRRILDLGNASFAPYISGRLAFLQQSIDVDAGTTTVTASASGAQINGGGGVLFRLSPRVNLDVGATYGLINFGDVEVAIPGLGRTTIDGTSGNGSNFVMRVGVAVGLGR
ncbi:MAG: outer membrane beta-barrel protein [Gemmatimonadaceae bacterium]